MRKPLRLKRPNTSLLSDRRFQYVLAANLSSSIGLGITMIAIPWLLVSTANGNQIYGYLSLAMTIFNFILTPLIGGLIDYVSRKKLIIVGKTIGLIIMFGCSLLGYMGQSYELWHLIVIYVTGSLYYTLFYPTMFAFTQECFKKRHYKALNGVMEVQGQIASVIAGGVASLLIMKVGLHWILLFNACTYLFAILFFMKVKLVKRSSKMSSDVVTQQKKMINGFTYLWNYPIMFYFLLCTTFPFIGVMITNYLFPVYLQQELQASAWVYGVQSMIYSVGAVCAGLFIPIISRKIGNEKTMILAVFCYTIAISFVIFAKIPIYLFLMFFLAFGNAGARVARATFMMEYIPNEYIGRVDSVIRLIGLFIRIILLAIFTKLVAFQLIFICFVILSSLLCVASLFVYVLWKRGLFSGKEDVHVARVRGMGSLL